MEKAQELGGKVIACSDSNGYVVDESGIDLDLLREIKEHPELRRIPIIIMTTSQAEEDIYRSYDLGANSFITKPVTFERLVDLMKVLGKYWIELVELPQNTV